VRGARKRHFEAKKHPKPPQGTHPHPHAVAWGCGDVVTQQPSSQQPAAGATGHWGPRAGAGPGAPSVASPRGYHTKPGQIITGKARRRPNPGPDRADRELFSPGSGHGFVFLVFESLGTGSCSGIAITAATCHRGAHPGTGR
jgi:hypothetical protein